jgi:hypothetical protein
MAGCREKPERKYANFNSVILNLELHPCCYIILLWGVPPV